MTAAQLKNYYRAQLVAQRTIAQEYNVLDAIVDFITQAITSGIPDWNAGLTFQTDGTDAGTYCVWPDDDDNIRFWKTKVDDNIGNEPPTDPDITEDAYWIEVSPSDGSAIKEWSAGVYGSGLVIVYHDHSLYGRQFFILINATRPFASTNIEDEHDDGDWAVIGTPKKTIEVVAADLQACGSTPVELIAAPGAGKFLAIDKVTVSKKAGAVAFDFDEFLAVKLAGGDNLFVIDFAVMNVAGNVNLQLVKQGQVMPANAALQLTTLDASDATVGDSDVRFIIHYTIETVLS